MFKLMLKRLKEILNWFETHTKISWLITGIIAVFIFYMSSKTFPPGIPGVNYLSYVYHFGLFFVFAFFLFISITQGRVNEKYLFIIAILIAIGYGIGDEIHQFFVPGRYCCYEDALTDSIGNLFAGVVYTWIIMSK